MIRTVPGARVHQTSHAVLAALGSLACALLTPWSPARADGLGPIARDRTGPVEVTVLSSPAPLQKGPTTWYVVVTEGDEAGRPSPEPIELLLTPAGPKPGHQEASLAIPLSRVSPSGRLWSGDGALTRTGPWDGQVRLRSASPSDPSELGKTLEVDFKALVAPRTSPILEHWQALLVAPLGIAGLALHQALTRRKRRSQGSR